MSAEKRIALQKILQRKIKYREWQNFCLNALALMRGVAGPEPRNVGCRSPGNPRNVKKLSRLAALTRNGLDWRFVLDDGKFGGLYRCQWNFPGRRIGLFRQFP